MAQGHSGWRAWRWAAIVAASIAVLAVAPGVAGAHAHLVRADPAADAVIAQAPPAAHFWFDENLNSALSRVVIRDAAGRQVTADTGHLAPGTSRELAVTLPRLATGTYSVQWTSDSADDGHILRGFYSFTIGTAGATAPVSPPAGIAEPPLDAAALAQIAARWLLLMLLALWTGLIVITLAVLLPAARRSSGSPPERLAILAAPRAMFLTHGALLGLLVASWLELLVQGVAAGGSLQALSPSLLRALLVGTHYGTLWLLRLGLLVVALVIIFVQGSAVPARDDRTPFAPAPVAPRVRAQIEAIVACTFLLALALSGHAATVPTAVIVSVAVDWAHLLAMAGWLGGIVALVAVVIPTLRLLSPRAREDALVFAVDRFSPVAAGSVIVLALSGLYSALQRIVGVDELLTTSYGRALTVKLFLIALLVLVSASHVFGVRRRLRRLRVGTAPRGPGGDARQAAETEAEVNQLAGLLVGRLQIEPWLGAGVLLCVAVMAATLPARPSAAPAAPPVTGPVARAGVQAMAPVEGSGLRVSLVVNPGDLGRNVITATVLQPVGHGSWHPESDAQVRFKVAMPAMLSMGTAFAETHRIGGGRYEGTADIIMGGDWHLEVLVRTPADPLTYRGASFRLTAGLYGEPAALRPWPPSASRAAATSPGALTLPLTAGPWHGTVTIQPGAYGPNQFAVHLADASGRGEGGPSVALSLQSLEMDMGTIHLVGRRLAAGDYLARGTLTMGGRWGLHVATRGGAGAVTFTAATAGFSMATGTGASGYGAPAYRAPLPYPAFVSELDGNAVTLLGRGTAHRPGPGPHGIDFVARRPWLYVTDIGGSTVTVLNIHTGRPVATIHVGLAPAHVIFGAGARRAYVTNLDSADVSVIDVAKSTVLARVPVGLNPHGIDITPDGRYVYVACILGGGVYKIDTRTNRVVAAIPTGLRPYGVAVDPGGKVVYVSDAMLNEVEVLDVTTDTVLRHVPVGKAPALMVAASDGRLYVANHDSNSVSVIDTARSRVVGTVPVGRGPHGLDATPDGRYVYVANNNSDTVSIISTRDEHVVATVHVAGRPNEVAIKQEDDLSP